MAHGHVQQLGQGPGHLDPGGPPADHDEGEQPAGLRARVAVGVLETAEDVVPEDPGVA